MKADQQKVWPIHRSNIISHYEFVNWAWYHKIKINYGGLCLIIYKISTPEIIYYYVISKPFQTPTLLV